MQRFVSEKDYANFQAVSDEYPSASKIIEVDGGWMVFDYLADEETWKAQK